MTPIPESRLAQIGDDVIPLCASMPTFDEARSMAIEIERRRDRARTGWFVTKAAAVIAAGVMLVLAFERMVG